MESSFQDPLQWFFGSSSDEWIPVPHFDFFYHNIFWLYQIHTTRRPQNGLLHTEEKEPIGTLDLRGSHQPLPQLIPLGLWTWHWRSPALRTLTTRPATQKPLHHFAFSPGRPSGPWNWLSSTVMARNTSYKYNNNPIYGMSENRVYSQWNSHLIGIMIINHWVQWGTQHFQTNPFMECTIL